MFTDSVGASHRALKSDTNRADALDVSTIFSYLHRRLDEAVVVPTG
jgi:hypothetical protein